MTNISREEAAEMKRRAIAEAIELDIANITKWILDNDSTTEDEWEKSRPLPGAGLIMAMAKSAAHTQAKAGGSATRTVPLAAADSAGVST